MTQIAINRVKVAWEIFKGIGIGLGVFIGTGILSYQKKTYDWQIEISNRMNNAERINATQDGMFNTRQGYEADNDKKNNLQDKQITYLYARHKFTLIQN